MNGYNLTRAWYDLINANEQIKYVFKLQLKRIAMAAIEQRRILSKI